MTDGKSPARQKQLSGVLDALAASFNVEVLTITPDQISRYLSARRVKEWSKRNHSDVIGDGSKHLGAIGLTMPDPLPDTVNTGLRSTVNWEEDNRSGQPDDLGRCHRFHTTHFGHWLRRRPPSRPADFTGWPEPLFDDGQDHRAALFSLWNSDRR